MTIKPDQIPQFLAESGVIECASEVKSINPKSGKNKNFVVELQTGHRLLIKQGVQDEHGRWLTNPCQEEPRLQHLLQYSECQFIHDLYLTPKFCDQQKQIIIFDYQPDHDDLDDRFHQNKRFPLPVIQQVGRSLGRQHQVTSQLLKDNPPIGYLKVNPARDFLAEFQTPIPEQLGQQPQGFFKLNAVINQDQQLNYALTKLADSHSLTCIVHGDFRPNNILVHPDDPNNILFIDLEDSSPGDPASDLGAFIGHSGSYWLNSMPFSRSMSIADSLRSAQVPLEQLQPAHAALLQAYLQQFPEVLQRHPDFVTRVTRFVGFALLNQIYAMLQHALLFDNTSVAKLQVAKKLLCEPEACIQTLFGKSESEMLMTIE